MGTTTRKWPKLKPGEQVRIRHIPTGKWLWKPKSSSGKYQLKADDFTVWSSFKGPGIFITELARQWETYDRICRQHGELYANSSYKPLGKPEDFVFEVVVMEVVRCINVQDQIEKQRELEREKEEDKKYKALKHDSAFRIYEKDELQKIVEEIGDGLRFRDHQFLGPRIHSEDGKEFLARFKKKVLS